jgi:hypothetical protein
MAFDLTPDIRAALADREFVSPILLVQRPAPTRSA